MSSGEVSTRTRMTFLPSDLSAAASSEENTISPEARSEERRVGKECRSRCDWSSDVCSSDLVNVFRRSFDPHQNDLLAIGFERGGFVGGKHDLAGGEIGRASCRERV